MRTAYVAILFLLGGLTTGATGGVSAAGASNEVVFTWNRILQANVPAGPPRVPSYYAAMHVAMFDAINAVERQYTPFRVSLRPGWGGAAEAAAAQVAHDVLVALIPGRAGVFDAALEAQLASAPTCRVNRGK